MYETYDSMDRLTSKDTYDAAGNLATMQSADGAVNVTYNWDELNRLDQVTDSRLGTTQYSYDNGGWPRSR